MKKIDFWLQKQRNIQATKHIVGQTLLDVGCHHGELFDFILKARLISGDGIDTVLKTKIVTEKYTLHPGMFPVDFDMQKKYDNITFLAVMEHIPFEVLQTYPKLLKDYLNDKGRIIITVPSKKVDYILDVLLFFNLIDGMDLEHHQDFDRNVLKEMFISNGYHLLHEYRFEMGLNLVFVFEKI